MGSYFGVIKKTHEELGHAGRDAVVKEITKNVCNIGPREVTLYINLCEQCQLKALKANKKVTSKPLLEEDFLCRGQIDLIDMRSRPDPDGFKFIFNYQDHFTKYLKLRALRQKTADEVADHLLEIFLDMGCPYVLQSDNGREFRNRLIERLAELWPETKVAHGKPRHSQSQGSVERSNLDIERILICWMSDHNSEHWARALPFVQNAKNRRYHRGIGMTPFEALYGRRPTNSINSLALPPDVINRLKTEEGLKALVQQEVRGCTASTSTSSAITDHAAGTLAPIGETEYSEVVAGTSQEAPDDCTASTSSAIAAEIRPIEETDEYSEVVAGTSQEAFSHHQKVLEHVQEIQSMRAQVRKRQHEQVEMMVKRSNKRMKTAVVGATVRVSVPEVDRGRTGHPNVLGVILEEVDELYRIGTRNGILEHLYSRNQLNVCAEKLLTAGDVNESSTISLRAAVGLASISKSTQGFVKCNCTTKCTTSRCSCRAKKMLCNSKCHGSSSCDNK